MTYETREEWLNQAASLLNDMLERTELKPAKRLLVAVGWPRNDRRGQVIGQCYPKSSSAGVNHIFISPTLPSPTTVLPVLLHELIHAADDCKADHTGAFRRAWKILGFVEKPTHSVPGKDLKRELSAIAKLLGPYPHTVLTPGDGGPGKPQVSRQLKIECLDCGCIARMSRGAIDEHGLPTCACGTEFQEAL